MHRVRSEGSATTTLYSQGSSPIQDLVHGGVAKIGNHHLHVHLFEYSYAGMQGPPSFAFISHARRLFIHNLM